MSPSSSRAVFVVVLLINCILWSQSQYALVPSSASPSIPHTGRSLKRSLVALYSGSNDSTALDIEVAECKPLAFPVAEQCSHVWDACPTTPTFLSIPYLQSYFCSSSTARPFLFAGFILWLIFLFSTLGISASDFFCPNLATLASILGLDENVAGVTFLAFGNGSPDVFSTFSAMRANSGSLAIGELLGAASFIVSCVVGAMCIIKPFKVNRGPFLRDIGFFTVAVTLFLVMLWDGTIQAWEAGGLVIVYVLYVFAVVITSWLSRRRERARLRDAMIRNEYAEEEFPSMVYHDDEPYRDDPSPVMSRAPSTLSPPDPYPRSRAISQPSPPRLEIETGRARRASMTRRASQDISPMPSFSLVGALEFREVVASLQTQAASSSLSVFDSPITPFPGGHYHQHHRHPRSRSRSPLSHDESLNPFDLTLGLPLNDRSPVIRHTAPPESPPIAPLIEIHDAEPHSDIPTISHTPASPSSEADSEVQHQPRPLSRRKRVLQILNHAYHILFPTLTHFRAKPWLGKIAGVFAAPAVLALTITLPVVVTPYDSPYVHEKIVVPDSGLNSFEEEGIERALIAEEEVEEEIHELHYNKWLMAAQCALGPLFCVSVLFKGMVEAKWMLLSVGITGLAVGALVIVFSDNGDRPASRLARCSMGFLVAMVWIMAIADEVVQVLQTFGFIFGLSDAIIGLTIFAVGNSLADLVANMSVAVFAPIMGFSACFGGPMLNMLLGVGISGSYIIHTTAKPYELNFSTTLVVSAVGLLALLVATMIFVPWNGYFIPRSWGVFLIGFYVVIMTVNVVVEVLDI